LVLVIVGIFLSIKYLLPNNEEQQPTQQVIPSLTASSREPTSTPYLAGNVEIFANKGWQSTGLQVETGDIIEITYVSGLWTGKTGNNIFSGPEGGHPSQDYPCNPISHKASGYNALIGKIWYASPFMVGRHFLGTTDVAGTLYLRMNDCDEWLVDNEGSIIVSIQVSQK